MRNRVLVCTVAVSALAVSTFGSCSAFAQKKWDIHIDFEAKPGSKRTLGEADLFVPLVQDERTLFFGNLRGRFDDDSSREGNLGLGVRRMQGGWNFGAYGYLDRRKSRSEQQYRQVTLGGEALGRDFDFRGNLYLPQGTRLQSISSTGGDSTASISGNTVTVATNAVTTREERVLKGFDAELGWRIPLFGADDARQLRLYAGGYRFKDEVTRVSGPRVRAEFTMDEVAGLWRGGQLIAGVEAQDDSARGGQVFFTLRVRVPLGAKAKRPRRMSLQERRMTAPVVRDVDIFVQERTFIASPASVETATTVQNGQTLTVLNSDTTTGAALPAAVAAVGANSTVVLSGTFNTTAVTTLQPGQTLAGATTLTVRTPSGRTATLTTPGATIASTVGGGTNPAVEMAANSALTGMNISRIPAIGGTGINPVGVRVSGVSGATITNSTITAFSIGSGAAIGVLIESAGANAIVSGNTITASNNASGGTSIALQVTSGATAMVTGNTLSTPLGLAVRRIVDLTGPVTVSGSDNVPVIGTCSSTGAITGSIGFTNGTTCP